MKQTIFFVIILLTGSYSYACNVCGSSGGNQYLGLLPQGRQNFIGVQYLHRGFTSEHPGHDEYAPSEFSKEKYNSVQLWGRCYVSKRIQILAFVPYISNIKWGSSGRTVVNGFGDISLIANVNLLVPVQTAEWKHQLQAGAGIKLPTGSYDNNSIISSEGLPNMQPGTKAWDFSFNANYTLRKERLGCNIEGAYTITTANTYDYKYGNKVSAGMLTFYQMKQKAMTFLPQAGFKLDLTSADYDQYSYKWTNDMTGGQQLYAVAGIQAYYNEVGFQASYHQPIYQHFASGLVNAKYKVETGIYFLFK